MLNGVNLHRAWPPLAGAMVLAILVTIVGFLVPAQRTARHPERSGRSATSRT